MFFFFRSPLNDLIGGPVSLEESKRRKDLDEKNTRDFVKRDSFTGSYACRLQLYTYRQPIGFWDYT